MFSSTYELQRLYKVEVGFSRDLHDYASRLRSHLDSMNAYLAKAYPDGPLDEAADPESYVSNPLNALGMMWREVSQFNDICIGFIFLAVYGISCISGFCFI